MAAEAGAMPPHVVGATAAQAGRGEGELSPRARGGAVIPLTLTLHL